MGQLVYITQKHTIDITHVTVYNDSCMSTPSSLSWVDPRCVIPGRSFIYPDPKNGKPTEVTVDSVTINGKLATSIRFVVGASGETSEALASVFYSTAEPIR